MCAASSAFPVAFPHQANDPGGDNQPDPGKQGERERESGACFVELLLEGEEPDHADDDEQDAQAGADPRFAAQRGGGDPLVAFRGVGLLPQDGAAESTEDQEPQQRVQDTAEEQEEHAQSGGQGDVGQDLADVAAFAAGALLRVGCRVLFRLRVGGDEQEQDEVDRDPDTADGESEQRQPRHDRVDAEVAG